MGFFLLFSHKYHPILWEVRTVKNILTIMTSIVLVLMLAIDIFFYQRPEGRMFMLILATIGGVCSIIMFEQDEAES